MPSAMVDRQILPRHTNSTDTGSGMLDDARIEHKTSKTKV